MSCALDLIKPGEVATVNVAWRLDDPDVQRDGRFWIKVPEEGADLVGYRPRTIIPAGQSLADWHERCGGDEAEVSNPVKGSTERISLRRWRKADPERTYLILSFVHRYEVPRPPSAEEVKRARDAEAAKPEPVRRLLREREVLQRSYRHARDLGDEDELARLAVMLEVKSDELARADFPNYTRGWDLSRAIRDGADRFVLDWTTGY